MTLIQDESTELVELGELGRRNHDVIHFLLHPFNRQLGGVLSLRREGRQYGEDPINVYEIPHRHGYLDWSMQLAGQFHCRDVERPDEGCQICSVFDLLRKASRNRERISVGDCNMWDRV